MSNPNPQEVLRTPWTTDDVLGQYVYVLPAKYVISRDVDQEVVFYAIIGDQRDAVAIGTEEAGTFLEQHKAKIFVTYDGREFHERCIQAVDNQPQYRSLVWQLVSKSRLWDVGLLDRVICLGCGKEVTCSLNSQHLHNLFQRFLDTNLAELGLNKQIGHLTTLLVRMLDYAVRELPVFKRLVPPEQKALLGDDFTNHDFCRAIDCQNYALDQISQKLLQENLGENQFNCNNCQNSYENCYFDCVRKSQAKDDDIPASNVEHMKINRRINVLLSAPNGPLGIGLNLQETLLANTLNSCVPDVEADRLDEMIANFKDRIQRGILNESSPYFSDIKSCFVNQKVNGALIISYDNEGYVCKNKKRLCKIIETAFAPATRDINIPFALPRNSKGECSILYADWLKYRDNAFIKVWTEMEATGVAMKTAGNNRNPFRSYTAFPDLRSGPVAIFSDFAQEPFLSPGDNRFFAEIRFNELDLRSMLAVNVGLYGLLPEMEKMKPEILGRPPEIQGKDYDDEHEYPLSICDYILNNITKTFARFRDQYRGDEGEKLMEPFYLTWEALSDEQKRKVIPVVAQSCMRHLSNNTVRSKLEESGIQLNTIEVGPLCSAIWLHLVSCRCPKYQPQFGLGKENLSAPGPELTLFDYDDNISASQKKELQISRFLFYRTVEQVCYKMDLGQIRCSDNTQVYPRPISVNLYYSVAEVLKNMIRQGLATNQEKLPFWTIVNHLEKIGPQVGSLASDALNRLSMILNTFLGSKSPRIPWPFRESELQTLYMTNPVSPTGQIGSPIHYVNATEADYELFRQSIPTKLAFTLLAGGYDVVWVSNRAILVRLRADAVKAQFNAIALTARAKATKIFQTASISNSGFHDWLARGLCTCQVVDTWPNGNVVHSHEDTFSCFEFKPPVIMPPKSPQKELYWNINGEGWDVFDTEVIYDEEDFESDEE